MAALTPPTTPPAAPTAAQNTTEGIQDQIALFNDQMYLLDSFAHEVDNPELFSAMIIDASVPPSPPFEKINDLITLSGNKIHRWIHDVTPYEYAQLIPKIQLFWVDVATSGQVEIPLVAPSDLDGGMESPYYYTTKAIGLKSIDMNIDGNTNPVTGKIYNINIKLIFDSLNTFFDPVSGLTGLRYADLFRSHGTAGSAGNKGTLKLSMSYDGPPELVTKYALDETGQAFTTYLNLVTSKLSVKENLYAEVDAKFQGFEEAVYKNNSIFDFLRIDLISELATQQGLVGTARAAQESAHRAAAVAKKSALDVQRSRINTRQAAIRNAVIGVARDPGRQATRYRDGPGSTAYQGSEYFEGIARNAANNEKLVNMAKAAGYPAVREVPNADGTKRVVITVDGVELPLNERGGADLVAEGLMNEYQAGKNPLEGQSDASLFADLNTAAQTIKEAKEKFARATAGADAAVAAAEKGFQANVQSARVTKITQVLQETIWDFEKLAFRTVSMTADEFSKYTQGLLAKQLKNYFTTNRTQVVVDVQKEHPKPQAPGRSLNKVTEDIRTLTKKLNVLKQKATPAAVGGLGSVGASAAAGPATVQRQIVIAKRTHNIDQANSRLAALRVEQLQISSTSNLLQSKTQLEAQLNEKKNIRFILLGDLLALIMDRLRKLAKGEVDGIAASPAAQKHLDDTVLVLTKIGLIQFGSNIVKKVSLYQMPISILQLQKVLSDLLHGNMKTNLTLFELLRAIINMIGLSQKRKAQALSVAHMSSDFALSFMTYPVHWSGGSGAGALTISTNPLSSEKKNGMIIWARSASTNLADADGTYATNKRLKIPHFFFGGYTHGAVKSIEMEEKSDKLALVAMSNLTTGGPSYVIPALFEATIKLVGTPFFQIGMNFYVDTPTLNIDSKTQGWFYLRAYYSVKTLSHSYTAGGQFTTTIEGIIQPLPAGVHHEILPADAANMSGGGPQETSFRLGGDPNNT